MPRVQTGFEISDAFRFRNRFSYRVSMAARKLSAFDAGLCGGMCYAALDYYLAGVPIPKQAQAPAQGTSLERYLRDRQVASLSRPGVLLKIAEWIVRSDETVARRTAHTEFPKLRERLDRREPAVLVLMRTGHLKDITLNHQVLALGYNLDERTGEVIIPIYDPNYPMQVPRLSLELYAPHNAIQAWHSTDQGFRGFFVQDYRQRLKGLPDVF